MDIYTLDSSLRRTEVIDRYESFIWKDSWRPPGDFQLIIPSNAKNRSLLPKATRLAINESQFVMEIDEVHEAEGKLTITGKSIEQIMEDRAARHSFTNLTTSPRWALEGTPGTIIRAMFYAICKDGLLNTQDIIPFIQSGTLNPAGTFPEPSTSIRIELEPQSLLKAVNALCVEYNLGYRIIRGPDTSKLYFEVYTGSDRTGGNATGLNPVVFSQDLDNLANVTELESKSGYKNTAYVFSPQGCTIVYANGDGSTRTGFTRRILVVNVQDARQNDNENYLTTEQVLQRRGKEALAKQRQISAFDGEILKSSGYKYKVDYDLGDMVEMRNSDNIGKAMRVTEQIFVSDAEGDRSYPTLSADEPPDS